MTGRVCIVGSINMDLVVRTPRLPSPGETLLGGPFARFPGGKGANQAVAASKAGAKVSMIGAVGDDEHGLAMRTTLADNGVDVSHVVTRPGTATGVALITVDHSGENTIVVASGANATLGPADVEAAADAIRGSGVLLAQLETPMETFERAAGIAREAGVRIVLNAAPATSANLNLPRKAIDVLMVNRVEAAFYNGRPGREPDLSAETLRMIGIPEVIVTLGAEGVLYLSDSSGMFGTRIPAFPVEPVDTVGAGDAFAGAFAAAIAENMPTEEALRFAAAAGALATTKQGAIPSLPTRAEIERLLG